MKGKRIGGEAKDFYFTIPFGEKKCKLIPQDVIKKENLTNFQKFKEFLGA